MRRAEESQLKNASPEQFVLLAPLTGPAVPLAEVPDPVFSGGMFGDGIGIDPLEGRLVAPCAGIVTHLARTGHAVTITTAEGAEVLLHIGIDTVELSGRGFMPKVEAGARVAPGDVLVEFDIDLVAQAAPSLVSVVAIANSDAFEIVERAGSGLVRAAVSPLLTLRATSPEVAGAARDVADAMEARRRITLANAGGLHARPAARAREAARGLDARVHVQFGERRAAIESVVGLLALGAGEGAEIELVGVGPQAAQAVDAIAEELQRAAHDEAQTRAAHALQAPPTVSKGPRPSGAALDPNTLAGVCAAPGIAVGKLVRWDEAELRPPELASGTRRPKADGSTARLRPSTRNSSTPCAAPRSAARWARPGSSPCIACCSRTRPCSTRRAT